MNDWFYKTIKSDGSISDEIAWTSGELPENAVVWDKSFLNQYVDRVNARIGACNIANAPSTSFLKRIDAGNDFVGHDTGDSFIDYCWDALKNLGGAWNGGTISSGITLFDSDDIVQVKYLSSIYSYLTEDKDIKNGSGIYDTAGDLVFDDSTRSRFRSLREIIDLVDTFCCDTGGTVFYGSTSDPVYGTGSAEWVFQWDPSGTGYESDSATCPVASQSDHPRSGDGSAWPWVWPYMAGRYAELYYGMVSCARISNGSIHLPAPGISVNITLTPYGRGWRVYEDKDTDYDNSYYATENALYSMSATTDTFGVSDRPSFDITSPFGTLDVNVGSGGSGYSTWIGVVAVLVKINDDDTPQP